MKKLILSIISIAAFNLGASAQNVNIPDADFKAYLIGNLSINTNSDTEIQISEANAFAGTLNCSSLMINDLTGIESFTSLTNLVCNSNNLTTIDLSQNVALLELRCSNNNLNTLNLSQNTALTYLSCGFNNLITSLDLSQNTALTYLSCGSNNLGSLDLSQNTALTYLSCSSNNLGSLDLSQNTMLATLDCSSSGLNSLILGQNQELTQLFCNQNNLTSLDLTQTPSLTFTWCYNNSLTSLDLSQNTSLTDISCHTNSIGSLDLSQNTLLTSASIYSNSLTSLNMKNLSTTTLTSFFAAQNPNLTCIEVDDVAAANSVWTNIDPASSFSLDCTVYVASIAVQGQSGATTITSPGGTLQMEATVLPANADDDTYTWSVTFGTGSASIDVNGLLTAITNGTVTVIATANDASGVTGTEVITISNQDLSVGEQVAIENIRLYPNPATSQLSINSELKIERIEIMNILGETVKTIVDPSNTVDVSELTDGVYFLKLQTDKNVVSKKFIKE
jgi:Leucine-rich repeat (LRR) protein